MVLVSMTILIIMGTLFTTISMRSYLYSYAKLCKQQAYYTAMSSVQSFHSLLKGNPGLIGTLTNSLNEALDDEINAGFEITDVTIEIGSTYGDGGEGYVPNGFFDSYMGRCTLKARYASADRNEISIEANANYKGYSDFARAKIARTNKAASELKKIFDNTFCLQSPISTIIGTVPNGDIYISQPALTEFTGDSLTDDQKAYNEVLGELKDGQNVNTTLLGQYIRDENGNIVTTGSEGRYNKVLRDELYGKAQASTGKSDLVGHTRPMDIGNKPMQKGKDGIIYFNDWVELYMFAPTSDGKNATTAVNGNIYAHSRMLIGLLDRDKNNTTYPMRWDDGQKRLVYPQKSDWNEGESAYESYISKRAEGTSDNPTNYEHGFDNEVFFDHWGDNVNAYNRTSSQFRVNGNMYLWEDARIENFDSTNTKNAQNHIKNNIYAYKNLVIDGNYVEKVTDNFPTKNIDYPANSSSNKYYVTIYGDVIVQGNAQIIGANITGDIYCFGSELTMINTNVNGNVYFAGGHFSSDNIVISGNLIIENVPKDNKPNVSYTSYDKDKFGSEDTVGRAGSSAQWGAVLTNTHVYGTLWSAVNTHIVASKWRTADLQKQDMRDTYGDIYVKTYLFLDGTREYAEGYYANWGGSTPPGSTTASSYNAICQPKDDASKETAKIFANKLQIASSQSNPIVSEDTFELGNILVGDGGMRIAGYKPGLGVLDSRRTVRMRSLFSASSTSIVDKAIIHDKYNGDKYPDGNVSPNATLNDVANRISGGAPSIEIALNNLLNQLKCQFGLAKTQGIGTSEIVTRFFTGAQADEIWKDKVIKLRKWSAPEHKTETEIQNGEPGTYYNGFDVKGGKGFSSVENFVDYILGRNVTDPHPEAGEVSADGKTLTIKESAVFGGKADFSSYKTVVFDTSEGNIHIRFQDGAIFGKNTVGVGAATTPSKVVLRGGNMVFVYLEQGGNYDMNNPTLIINDGCSFGVVEASQGTNYGNDGLYVISNDDILIRFAGTTEFNGFVYAPQGHLFVMPGNDGTKNTFNGCMAIESLIILTDAEEAGEDIIQIIIDWWTKITGGGGETIDPIVPQYANCVYNYVMPPLIVDAGMSFGGTDEEVVDFGQVVWEFMGFY